MTELTNEALRLPPMERLKLIEEVWDSLAADQAAFPATSQELEELERRRKRYVSNPDSLIDWQEMKARLFRRRDDAH